MKRHFVAVISLFFLTSASAGDGLVSKKSGVGVEETLDRLEAVLEKKGITIFSRVSHTAGAEDAGIELRPTELLIFGNPRLGSHFFTSRQTAGIDLPMKALAWEDADGQVWLTYNDPAYLVRRHTISDRAPLVEKMRKVLSELSAAATGSAAQVQ